MAQPFLFSDANLQPLMTLGAPMWVFDPERSCICWANSSGLSFWKVSSVDELDSRAFSNDSEIVKDRLSVVVKTLKEHEPYIDSWTLYPNGKPTQVRVHLHRVKLEYGDAGILVEVTEQNLTGTLNASDLRMLEAARAMSSMVTMMSLDGHVLVQNPAALKCYGHPAAAGAGSTDLQSRILLRCELEAIQSVVSENKIMRLEASVKTREGVRVHSVTAQRGRDPVTGDAVILLSEDDISELSDRYRNQKQEATELRRAVQENTDRLIREKGRIDRALEVAAIWEWDIAADKLYFSPNFMGLLGYEPAEFVEKLRTGRFQSILHPDDYIVYQPVLAKILENPDKPISHEMRFVTKSGDYLWIQIEGKCFCDDEGKPVRTAGLLTNITQKRQMEATLLASQKLEAIGQLTGGIAHDFNNLLTVIIGNAQLLQESGTANEKLTSAIISAVESGAELTRQLLAFARKQSLRPEPVDIRLLCTTMCETLFRILSVCIDVVYEGEDQLWDAYADAAQLEAALLNIALNARDAMPSGGTITLSAKNITIDLDSVCFPATLTPGDYVQIAVSDTGTGMTPETCAKAFDPFFSTKDVGQGTGLGLSMVLGFSQQSGGTTDIITELGSGTTISVFLPRAVDQRMRPIAVKEPTLHLGHGEHVHILEDTQEVSLAVSEMIKSLGYRVSTSMTVAEALLYAEHHADIKMFVADVKLPGGQSGVDFASQIRKVNPEVTLILMSGYPDAQLMRDIAQTVDFMFLAKPFSRAKMANALANGIFK